ncbi:hypothetical protein PIB30_046451, partial [Stylosanthes scabra]|nr:hypothetical protein [Stylosanthes scabra]
MGMYHQYQGRVDLVNKQQTIRQQGLKIVELSYGRTEEMGKKSAANKGKAMAEPAKKSEHPEKRSLVNEMGFGALSYLPNEYLNQRLLRQIYDRYDIYDNTIYSDAAAISITMEKIGHALGLSSRGAHYDMKVDKKKLSQEDIEVLNFFQGSTTVALQNLIKTTPVDTDENKKLWMRAFMLFVQQ